MQRTTMSTQEDLLHLRNWMSSQPHLPPVSDKQLTLFLHSCKFHLELTKKTIETYFSVKTSAPEFFSERDPVNAEIQQIKDVIQLAPLPEKSPEGYKILMGRLIDTDPSNYQLNSCIKFLFMVIDACQEVEGPQSGLVYIFDMQGITFGHLSRINIMSVKKYFLYSQEGMPVRLKAVHILNVNSVISQVMAIIKQFISKDRIQMIHLHTGVPQEFLNAVPQRLLPSDYNGNQPPLGQLFDDTLKTLRNLKEWFMEDEKLKSDESKRDKTRSQRSSFGMDGSFKKLDID